jgi:hypothetical protein
VADNVDELIDDAFGGTGDSSSDPNTGDSAGVSDGSDGSSGDGGGQQEGPLNAGVDLDALEEQFSERAAELREQLAGGDSDGGGGSSSTAVLALGGLAAAGYYVSQR